MRKQAVAERFPGSFPTWLIWTALLLAAVFLAAAPARAQTPSPLAEWQFSSGIQTARLFEPTVPTWETELGIGTQFSPTYEGGGRYHVQPGPAIDIRYKDIFFLSTGEGLGANLFSFRHIRFGAAISYDTGRSIHADGKGLGYMGTIHPTPEVKLFADYTLAKAFPLDIRLDARKQIWASRGYIGDLGAYLPMPGSSEKFVWFLGPTVTYADARYMYTYFGISARQAAETHRKEYKPGAGFKSAGLGLSAAWVITPHVILDADGAFERLLSGAADSPITVTKYEGVASVSAIYKF